MSIEEIEFLQHSNYIEGVNDEKSLNDSVESWKYALEQKELNLSHIIEIHRLLLQNIHPNIAGKIREVNVSVGGRLCPNWRQVPMLLHNWISKHGSESTEETIKDAHIRFEKIHPFEDGNGRCGRIIMNWQRVKADLPILVIHEGDEQSEYYNWFH